MATYIFDWKRTLYDPESAELTEGVIELLEHLNQENSNRLILVGKGSDDMHREVKRLGVGNYFADIKFQEGDKDTSLFIEFIDKNDPKNTVFVGDRARSELAVGNSLGATTIWVKQGKFSEELPIDPVYVPTHTVCSLGEALKLVKRL